MPLLNTRIGTCTPSFLTALYIKRAQNVRNNQLAKQPDAIPLSKPTHTLKQKCCLSLVIFTSLMICVSELAYIMKSKRSINDLKSYVHPKSQLLGAFRLTILTPPYMFKGES